MSLSVSLEASLPAALILQASPSAGPGTSPGDPGSSPPYDAAETSPDPINSRRIEPMAKRISPRKRTGSAHHEEESRQKKSPRPRRDAEASRGQDRSSRNGSVPDEPDHDMIDS